jgi:hypothetical protein
VSASPSGKGEACIEDLFNFDFKDVGVAVYCENHTEHTGTVRTSQETDYVSTTEPNRLMLFGETVTVYCENRTEHTDTSCGKKQSFDNVNEDGTYRNHCAVKSQVFSILDRKRWSKGTARQLRDKLWS